MNTFWSAAIRGLEPYVPGEQPKTGQLVKLNTNENPYPPSPQVLSALQACANADLRLYPDPEGHALRRAIANLHGFAPDNVFLGNGSDEVLAHAFLALLKHERPILFPDITYSFYPIYCALFGIEYETVPLDADFCIDVADYAKPNGGIVIANPNAPTGTALDRLALRRLLDASPGSVVLVDEAYVDFGAESAVPLIESHPNLLVTQTLSKSRSLAGLRVGYALGDAGLIAALNVVKGSFNSYPLDRLALAGAEAALGDAAYFEATTRRIVDSREKLASDLAALGFEVLPSRANFLFVRHADRDAGVLHRQLRERGVLVRHFRMPRISNFLRITVGTPDQCARLLAELREALAGAPS